MRKSVLFLVLLLLTACARSPGQSGVQPASSVSVDREGYPISIPDEINTIISIGPDNTEILVALGLGHKIIGADTFSYNVYGIQPGISVLDMMSLDAEFIINAQPDVILVTGMTRVGGEDPLSVVSATGISVIHMPVSASIADIIEDIRFIAAVVGEEAAGEHIITQMEAEMDYIRHKAEAITDRKRVYFEIYPAPFMISLGTGTFLHEMIELVGAENIFFDREGWFSVADEVILIENPDVILTTVDFMENAVAEIKQRPGWGALTAVQNNAVFYIDGDSSSRPSHNITKALWEMARAIYPQIFN